MIFKQLNSHVGFLHMDVQPRGSCCFYLTLDPEAIGRAVGRTNEVKRKKAMGKDNGCPRH